MSSKAFQLARHQVLGNDATCTTVDDDKLFHLVAGVELHVTGSYLTAQRGVGAQQQLLSGLALGIERAGNLGTAERAVGQRAAVLACERNALGYALVDDVAGHLGQTIDVGLAGAVVAALHGVVEQAVNRVTVVLVVLCGIDASLCGDGVCTTGRVLNAEVEYFETHFAQRGGCAGSGQARAHHDDVKTALVGGVYQFLMSFVVGPLLGYRSFRYFRIYSSHFFAVLVVSCKSC